MGNRMVLMGFEDEMIGIIYNDVPYNDKGGSFDHFALSQTTAIGQQIHLSALLQTVSQSTFSQSG